MSEFESFDYTKVTVAARKFHRIFCNDRGTDQWGFRLCIYGGFGIRCDGCKTDHLADDFARNPGIFSVGNRISAL